MATYPSTPGTLGLLKAFDQLRKGFPPKVDAAYRKRFHIAPSNESYVIAVLRFLGLIDEDGVKRDDKVGYFFGSEETFQAGLETAVKEAYADLFVEMGEGAFSAPRENLGHWFRGVDKTTELVGSRQAGTFLALASLAGHAAPPQTRPTRTPRRPSKAGPSRAPASKSVPAAQDIGSDVQSDAARPTIRQQPQVGINNHSDVGLTVRIEVNLPAGGDADTYDAIFASIKRHLIP